MLNDDSLKIKPPPLREGDTIGVFTPSTPGYAINPGLFKNGVRVLESLGFKVKLGSLTKKMHSQGYRSGSPQERAAELMELICDAEVRGIIATIGGYNSSSLIPYLDYKLITNNPKVICGYSDITSLHLAILHYSGLSTFYGPSLMTWIGEYPNGDAETISNFLDAVTYRAKLPRIFQPPKEWSNHRRRWDNNEWKTLARQWNPNQGWFTLREGSVCAPIVLSNLSTLVSAAGTPYFPDLENKILLIEEEDTSLALEERNLRHLELIGVFDRIVGLIVGKPEKLDDSGNPFSHDQLILEITKEHGDFPIISNFDCGHTVPTFTIRQHSIIGITASNSNNIKLTQFS